MVAKLRRRASTAAANRSRRGPAVDRGRERRSAPAAAFGGLVATGLREVTTDPAVLDRGGRWAVLVDFEGGVLCARFDTWSPGGIDALAGQWEGPAVTDYISSLDRGEYRRAVEAVRERIAAGEVYQANICRTLRAQLPDPTADDIVALAALLAAENPSPYQGFLRLPEHGVRVATASPELYLRRESDWIGSDPIKGTGRTAADISGKDHAENIMIVDLVRNDLAIVCQPGTVTVPDLLAVEVHPGVTHLVSRVSGKLKKGVTWPRLLEATFPPGSVSGAPKYTALRAINELETVPRGPYCGAIGWVDADTAQAELAVAIRTFWIEGPDLCFGTGAGITWGSNPEAEWEETVLKADLLTRIASRRWP